MTLLHQRSDPLTLGVARAAVFCIWLAVVVPDRLAFLGTLPRSMFEPIGLLKAVPRGVWDALLVPGALRAFEAVLVVLLVLAAAGVRPYRAVAFAAALGLTIHQGLLRSFTFDNHEELALLLCTYVLVLFPAADGFSVPRRRGPSAPPVVYAAAMLAMTGLLLLPYAEIAAHRLAYAAPAVFTGESLAYWFASLDSLDRDGWDVGLSLLGHPAPIAAFKAGFAVTTVFELLAPLCLILPRFRRVWIVVVVSLHVVNWFTLNLFFWQNALLVLLLVTDTEAVVAKARALVLPRQPVSRIAGIVRGAKLGLRLAPLIATGPARARVALAAVLFCAGRTRPMRLRLTAPGAPVTFTVPDHAALMVFQEVFIGREYALDGVEPPATILDLGANVGVSALFFRRQYPDARIVAVEASPALCRLLRENTADLGVEVRDVAVAARSGTATFYESAESWTGSTIRAVGPPVQVAAVSLDELLECGADLVKIDVEGAEFEVLPASRRLREARLVVGEIHAPPASAAPLLAALDGFDVATVANGHTVFRAVRRP